MLAGPLVASAVEIADGVWLHKGALSPSEQRVIVVTNNLPLSMKRLQEVGGRSRRCSPMNDLLSACYVITSIYSC